MLLDIHHIMAMGVEGFGWTMCIAVAQRHLSLTAIEHMVLGLITATMQD